MKKIFSLFAAALLSVSMFASVDTIPSDQVLADYYESGQLCVCVYFQGEVCNDIVWAGTYNGWATDDLTTMPKFVEVDGYDGWYVVAVDDATDPSSGDGICGKPVQLKSDGSFSWDFQTGDAASWTLIRGSVNIIEGYSGEADMKGWSIAQPNVLVSAYWKNQGSPCVTVPTHKYTIKLNAPLCADAEGNYFAPAIIGTFNNWAEGVTMELDEQTLIYSYVIEDEENHEFKFKAVGDTDWSNQIRIQDEGGNWIDNPNIKLPVATKDTTLEIDYSAGTYTKCVGETPDTLLNVVLTLKAPAFCADLATYADSVQVAGDFDGWAGTFMTKGADNTYTLTIDTVISGTGYKFKAGTDANWSVQLQDANGDLNNSTFAKGETEITKDFSTGEYYWKGCPSPVAIPEVKAAKSAAKKVLVNGQMVIMVGENKYNVLGTEVK